MTQRPFAFRPVMRRTMLGAMGVPLLAASAVAQPGTPTATEQANLDLVTRFCKAWETKDVEQLIPFVAEDLEYHVWEGGPVIKGVAQLRQQMGPYMAGMQTIRWEILRSAAMGDLVLNDRDDHFIRPPGSGKKNDLFVVTGVFLVRDGKVRYWKDYTSPRAKA
jgi:limonene-1,2-epoxide hydrolase